MTEHVARRAIQLQAIGRDDDALAMLAPVFTDPGASLELVVDMTRVLLADPASDAIVTLEHRMPTECARLAMPVISEVIALTRGDHIGGLHQIWHRLDQHVRTDVLAAILALAGQVTRHPERN